VANADADANAMCPASGMDDRVTQSIGVDVLVEALMHVIPRGAA
jgi:hypothetical protein